MKSVGIALSVLGLAALIATPALAATEAEEAAELVAECRQDLDALALGLKPGITAKELADYRAEVGGQMSRELVDAAKTADIPEMRTLLAEPPSADDRADRPVMRCMLRIRLKQLGG